MDLLAHLEAYVAIAEENSFSGAADVLGIAQPLLSRRIKQLEDHLGGELFDRSRRQIARTAFGDLLLPYAREVLSRADQLRRAARTAQASAIRMVGVPAGCSPTALARLIRAGTRHGRTIGVRELPATERADRLADGTLAYALLRVPPESAALTVPLGLAAAGTTPLTAAARPLHLDSLRPRRGTDALPPTILLTEEDAIPFAAERFTRAAAHAGLPEQRIRRLATGDSAVAETLVGGAVLLCAEQLAERNGLAWSPLADPTLHRGYELAGGAPAWMLPPLAEAIGTSTNRPSVTRPRTPNDRTDLAAHG